MRRTHNGKLDVLHSLTQNVYVLLCSKYPWCTVHFVLCFSIFQCAAASSSYFSRIKVMVHWNCNNYFCECFFFLSSLQMVRLNLILWIRYREFLCLQMELRKIEWDEWCSQTKNIISLHFTFNNEMSVWKIDYYHLIRISMTWITLNLDICHSLCGAAAAVTTISFKWLYWMDEVMKSFTASHQFTRGCARID